MSRGSRQQTIPQNRHNTAKPKENFWDNLHDISNNAKALLMSTGEIRSLMADEDLKRYLADPSATASLINALARDLKEYTDRWSAIYAQHKDRTGDIVNEDERSVTLDISLQYFDLTENFQGAVLPYFADLTEHLMTAAQSRENAQQAAASQGSKESKSDV